MAIPVLLLLALVLLLTAKSVTTKQSAVAQYALESVGIKPRAVVFTDGEVDDQDSFIRLLMYSDDIDIEGLVITSSEWHYAGDGKGTKFTSEMGGLPASYGARTDLRWPGTQWIYDLLDKYGEVQPNMAKHDTAFPTSALLKSRVKIGNIKFEGEMTEDTEGSEYVRNLILDTTDKRPLYMLIWGGTNTLARALKSIEETCIEKPEWEAMKKAISSKVIIYAVLDQDATYRKYVSVSWPDIRVIYNASQFWAFAYVWPKVTPPDYQTYLGGDWYKKNIKFNHGPLLSSYCLWGDGHHISGDEEDTFGDTTTLKNNRWGMMNKYDFISEGDSPSFLFLLEPGLRCLENYSYGGFGGRFVQSQTNPCRWEDGASVTDFNPFTGKFETSYPQVRWVKAIQEDFAARADWCVKDFSHANHAPSVEVKHGLDVNAKPGSRITFRASAKDPDGDKVNLKWWQYAEAGTFPGKVLITGQQGLYDKRGAAYGNKVALEIPANAKPGQTIHIILEASDDCPVPMSTFRRVIVTII